MNDVQLQEKMMSPFVKMAEGLEKTIDPKLAAPLMEFFGKVVEAVFTHRIVLMDAHVGTDGTLHAIGGDGETAFSVKAPLVKDPESMQEICRLMIGMTEGTRRATEHLK